MRQLVRWQEVGPVLIGALDVARVPESTFRPFLTDSDIAQTRRILPPVGRATAMASRALVRAVLADRLGCEPQRLPVKRWCHGCQAAGHGRPYLDDPRAGDFSVSHAGSLVVLALTAAGAVGVDIEELRELDSLERLVATTLTPAEAAHVRSGDGPAAHRYLTVWTRKEAAVKLTGEGLARNLAEVDTLDQPLLLSGVAEPITLLPVPLGSGFTGHVALSREREHSSRPPDISEIQISRRSNGAEHIADMEPRHSFETQPKDDPERPSLLL